ncbi:MAG: phosphatidylglycerophosphatase A [Bryobacteraceae bacterium]
MKATNRIAAALGTWFGCGYAPKGPGTAGSLGGLLPAFLLHRYARWEPWEFGLLALALFGPAVWSAHVVARETGRKDPQIVVIDEVVGQWITLAGASRLNWESWLAAFALFRLFDIWKPFPVRQLEALPGGAGIVMDDVMAGVYGALVLFAAGCFNLY